MSMRLAHDWYPDDLPDNVHLDPDAWLYSSYAFLHYHSRQRVGLKVGRSSGLYHGTFFDLGPCGRVDIGDFSTIVGAIICTNGHVSIGDYTFLAHEVTIADSFAAQADSPENAPRNLGKPAHRVVIGDLAWIGAGAVILGSVAIGRGAVIGAGAVVQSDVPDLAIVGGNPARILGRVPS
jgi:acetyltransferase-like isoleucine patch superfamily enzyme